MLVNYLTESFFPLGSAGYYAVHVAGVLLCMVIPYLLGSLNFAIIISKIFFRDDIRKYGSGNAGTTNMLRTYGKLPAAATLLLDMSKGAVAVLIGFLILGSGFYTEEGYTSVFAGTYIAGLFAILGHMFPCFYRFKGGKGVATTAVVILCTNPFLFAVLLLAFVIIVAGSKMISLGSVMCMLLYPLLLHRFSLQGDFVTQPQGILVSFLIAALVIFMHRSNIKRIWEGKESKLSFKKHAKVPAAEQTDRNSNEK
ncbi:MAG: glycerol-3-phosphate 1-O-acyltransferase PlsY [Clostridia bacterium]|nr:glycerol-3-phosphate 1-O-acyltransferase PlsY [Clostridia bacterium]